MGRIITRTTQDINSIDNTFANLLQLFIRTTINIMMYFGTTVIMAGSTTLFPAMLVVLVGGTMGRIFLIAQVGIRRELSNTKSKVMAHFGTSISSTGK